MKQRYTPIKLDDKLQIRSSRILLIFTKAAALIVETGESHPDLPQGWTSAPGLDFCPRAGLLPQGWTVGL